MITCKESTRFRILQTELLRLLTIADQVFAAHHIECIVTSGTDAHGTGDPHFNGFAADFRTHHIALDDIKHAIVSEMQAVLGDDYYIFLEAASTPNEHIHGQTRKGLWQQLLAKEK